MPPRSAVGVQDRNTAHLDQRRKVVNQPGVIPIGQGYGCAAGNGSGRHRVGDRYRIGIYGVRIRQGMGDGSRRNREATATGSASTACVSGRVCLTAAAGTA